jgi:iron complex transport system permease protein
MLELLAALLVVAFLMELTIGVVWIPPSDVVAILSGAEPARASWATIVNEVRLPRALAAMIVGAAIGLAGLLLQTLFRNPLADPWIIGVIHGARLGVAIVIVVVSAAGTQLLERLGALGEVALGAAAGLGATFVILVLLALAPKVRPVTLLILGLMIGFSCQGLISVVLHFTDEGHANAFFAWDDGNFAGATFAKLRVFSVIIAGGVLIAASITKPLNALLLGENYARSIGVAIQPVRIAALASTAILAGAVTAFAGPIAFLGILAPHFSRALLRTQDHRLLLPAVAMSGACIALLADLIVHLPWSRHFLHVNAVIGLFGAPFLFWAIARNRGEKLMDW